MSQRTNKFPAPPHLDKAAADVWREIVRAHLDVGDETIARKIGPGLESFCNVVATQRWAAKQIATDGRLVKDQRAMPVPHPAIAIQNDATREINRNAEKYQPKPARTRRTL